MPSITISSPMPSLLAGLTPVPANPIAALDASGGDGFGAVIAGLGEGLLLDAPPPPAPPATGTPLPPQRPDIAGAPLPLPIVDVEQVMVGSGELPVAQIHAPQAPVVEPAAPADFVPPKPVSVSELEAPDQPISRPATWPPNSASPLTLARATPRPAAPMPAEVERQIILPNPLVSSGPAPLAESDEMQPVELQPPVAAAPILPVPAVLPPVVPVAWNTPPPAPSPIKPEESVNNLAQARIAGATPQMSMIAQDPARLGSLRVGRDAAAPSPFAPIHRPIEPAFSPATSTVTPEAIRPQASPMIAPAVQPAPVPVPVPPIFTLPPEMARQVAQLVREFVAEETPAADPSTPATAPIAQPASVSAPVQPAFASARDAVLDTTRSEWLEAMIERIAEMPEADGKREAQIRLRPDALGVVDVKIEQRQERLHVTVNADTAQARQLLSEAAPRLQELAEARGIRFAQTDIGGGHSQERRPAPEQPRTPLHPRAASAAPETDSRPTGDLIA